MTLINQHINDPRYGGIGCFGVHVARKNSFFPDQVENFTWDVTELMDAPTNGGFGVCERVGLSTYLSDGESFPRPILSINRSDGGTLVSTIWDGKGSPLYFKEPKIVAHGLYGFRFAQLLDSAGRKLGPRWDLNKLPAPNVKTLQFRHPDRGAVRFTGSKPPLVVSFDKRDWDRWADDADRGEPLAGGARYCLQGPPMGKLSRAWEIAHWPNLPIAGVMFHAWEGGSGYMDCLCAFRPAILGASYRGLLKVSTLRGP